MVESKSQIARITIVEGEGCLPHIPTKKMTPITSTSVETPSITPSEVTGSSIFKKKR